MTSLTVSLAELLSPPPPIDATLVTVAGAVPDTLTVNVTGGKLAPAPSTSARVHDTGDDVVHVQPVPLTAVAVTAAGNVSTSVTTPDVGLPPTLVMVAVNTAPVCPCVTGSTCVALTARS